MSIFLPSLLEYSVEELQRKCLFIQNNTALIQHVTGQKICSLHLDFVLPQFAKSCSVMASLQLETVLNTLAMFFINQPLELTIHIMGEVEDVMMLYKHTNWLAIPQNWRTVLFVDDTFKKTFEILTSKQKHLTIGTWINLGEWQKTEFIAKQDYLLMTVQAGKSGQKRQDIDKIAAINVATKNPQSAFIFDGGWGVNEHLNLKNTSIVSYSSFWKVVGYNSEVVK